MTRFIPLLLPFALASCATSPDTYTIAEEDQVRLDELLEGRVAGDPETCLPTGPTFRSTVIDDRTIVYSRGSTRYLQRFQGSCNGLERPGASLVVEQPTGRSCRGEIIRVVDLSTGIQQGACSFGDFVPYREVD